MSRCHCNNSTRLPAPHKFIFAELARVILPADESCPNCFEQRCQNCHACRHSYQIPIINTSPEEAFLGRLHGATSSPALCNYQTNQASGHTGHDHSYLHHSAGQGQLTASDRQGQEHPNTGGWESPPPRQLGYVVDHSSQGPHTHDTRAINFERETELVLHRGPDVQRGPAYQHDCNHPGRSTPVDNFRVQWREEPDTFMVKWAGEENGGSLKWGGFMVEQRSKRMIQYDN